MNEQDIHQNVEPSEQYEGGTEAEETVTETEANTTPAEEFDVIKYNKEEVRIPVSERQNYLQKGYNYDKVQSQLEEAKQQAQYLERIAKMQGYENPADFIKAVEEMEQQRRYEEDARKLGVDEQVIREHLDPMRRELETLKEEREQLRQAEISRQVDAEVMELKAKYPDFEQVMEQVFDLAIEKGYALEDAYILSTYQDKAKKIEQETLAKVADRDSRQVLSSIDKPGNFTFDPTNLSSEQIKEISRRVQNGERITF